MAVVAIVLVGVVVLPILSTMYLQPEVDEQIVEAESQLAIAAAWRMWKIILASLALLVAASGALFLLARWRKVRVFVIFYHGLEERVQVMCENLLDHGVDCSFIPFDAEAEHDSVLSRVLGGIRSADVVIAIPGPKPSFVDSEILSATTLHKPLVIITDKNLVRRPGTAYEGYPRLRWEQLEVYRHRPLADFLKYLFNHWGSAWSTILIGWRAFAKIWSGAGALIVASFFFIRLAYYFTFLVSAEVAPKVLRAQAHGPIIVAGVATVFAFVAFAIAIVGRMRAKKIAKQTALTGKGTFQMLTDAIAGTIFEKELAGSLLRAQRTGESERDASPEPRF